MKTIQVCLGENIRMLRQKSGYTQRSFAEKFGFSSGFLQNIEAGKKWVGPETITRLARAFQVSESELFRDCERGKEGLDHRVVIAHLCESLGIDIDVRHIHSAPMRK